MKIRNDHPVARLIPSQHTHADPGQEIDWPDTEPVPDGFTVTAGPPAPPAEPTKKELLELATSLGVTVPSRATKPDIAALIAAATPPPPSADDTSAATDQQEL